jgi:multiple antibiotic resistance protein
MVIFQHPRMSKPFADSPVYAVGMLPMLTIASLTLKKAITLFALVEPLAVIPIFVATAAGLDEAGKIRFARTIAISVTVALLVATFLGMPLLALLGVSLGAMQVGGGIIVLLLAIAMVLGKETSFKGMAASAEGHTVREAAVIPLAVPLLAGPAAFSYVMANGSWHSYTDLIHVVLPILIVGLSCWLTFRLACSAERQIRKSTLDLVERIGGFILAAIAVEMMATGLRGLFPALSTV